MPLILNGTTGVSGVDGSAGTPSYQGTDTNTGIFYPAADTIAFAEGGTEVMRIDSSGNVGIGTSSPTQRLSVSGSITSTGRFIPLNGSTILGYVGDDNTISGGTGSNIGIRSDTAMLFATGGSTERMRITTGGQLCVGTTTALERVTVAGKVSAHTFYGGGQVVTCAVVNTWYKVQDGYFGLYVFRDGSLGGNVVLVFDGTAGATIISNTVTTFEARNNGGNLEIRVTSSAPRQFYWVCLSSVPS